MTDSLYELAFGVGTTLVLLLLFRVGQHALAPREESHAEAGKKNLARALFHAGNVVGIFLIASSVVRGAVQLEHDVAADLLWASAFGLTALVVFSAMSRLGTAMLLGARLPRELERGNAAAGLAAGASSVATAILVARSINGSNVHEIGTSLVFFLLALVSTYAFVALFRWLTAYDDSEEIIGENNAAALSYAGLTIAVAIIVGRAVEGDFKGWQVSLEEYALALAFVPILWPVRQLVVEGIILGSVPSFRRGKLDAAIARDRDVGMGALEGGCYVATALAIHGLG